MEKLAFVLACIVVALAMISFQAKKAAIVGVKHKGNHLHISAAAAQGHLKHGDVYDACGVKCLR